MTIKVGDKVPSVTLRYVTPDGVKAVTTDEFFAGKKVVLFGLPGAYTRTCSERHLPGYVEKAADLKVAGRRGERAPGASYLAPDLEPPAAT